jgi:hypothetical protein
MMECKRTLRRHHSDCESLDRLLNYSGEYIRSVAIQRLDHCVSFLLMCMACTSCSANTGITPQSSNTHQLLNAKQPRNITGRYCLRLRLEGSMYAYTCLLFLKAISLLSCLVPVQCSLTFGILFDFVQVLKTHLN